MTGFRPRPAFLFVPVVLVLALASMVLYHSLETDRVAERARQERFMRTAAFSVVDDLGSELFTMYSAFSLDLMARRDSGTRVTKESLTEVIARYRAQARFPDLFRDLVCLTKGSPYDAHLWTDRGWSTGALPDWAGELTTASTNRERFAPRAQAFSLEKPVLTIFLRTRSPAEGDVVAVSLRFSAKVVLEQIVPALVRQRFAETQEAQPYRASVQNRNQLRDPGSKVDWEVPLIPWTPFDTWFDYYLNRLQTMDRSRIGAANSDSLGTGWSLAVTRAPLGLEAEMMALQWRNLGWSLGFFLTLMVGFTGLYETARRASNRAQQERSFMALVSHELKTPLAVVRSLADNLARGIGTDSERAKEYGTVLLGESERLAAMVGNVLALTAIQGGIHPRDLVPVDLGELVRDRLARQAPVSGLEVSVQIHPGLTPVQGHPAALSAAVDNLIENAYRHGLVGPGPHLIRVVVEPRQRGRRRGTEFLIEDNGPGFTWSEGRRLLRPFHRGQRAQSAQTPGGGIGLSLIRTTAQTLGGRLDWEGRSGRGARFKLWFREARP